MHLFRTHPANGYQALLALLQDIGVEYCSGVTGGGVIHFLKHLASHDAAKTRQDEPGPAFFSIQEYVAGFVPLGSYLVSGRVGACVATTGAASKLLACGLSDAKLHDIPAVYLMPLCPAANSELCPLQDTTEAGSDIVAQLKAELPDGVFLLDAPEQIGRRLQAARDRLAQQQPVVLLLEHQALNTPFENERTHRPVPTQPDWEGIQQFFDEFIQTCAGRRVTILAGEELARVPEAKQITTRLCQALGAPVVWSINGVNGVAHDNPYTYGCIAFGGNDVAMEHWQHIGADDVLLVLGACPDEYTLNLGPFPAGHTFLLSGLEHGYGRRDGSFRHRARHDYRQLIAPLENVLDVFCDVVEQFRPQTDRKSVV